MFRNKIKLELIREFETCQNKSNKVTNFYLGIWSCKSRFRVSRSKELILVAITIANSCQSRVTSFANKQNRSTADYNPISLFML